MSASTYPASALAEYGWPAVPRDFDALLANIGPARTVGFDELLPLPDTKLAREVDAFAKKALPGGVYNHSVRVYLFGEWQRRRAGLVVVVGGPLGASERQCGDR